MTLYGWPNRRWNREDVIHGLWLSLGIKDQDAGVVVEVSSRKFFSFPRASWLNDVYGTRRWFLINKVITYDHIVVSNTPAGPITDWLHNGKPVTVRPGGMVHITPHWDNFG